MPTRLLAALVAGVALVASVALVGAAPASAAAPGHTSKFTEFLPQTLDPGEAPVATNGTVEQPNPCSFPILFYGHSTRDFTTFDNGDQKIHIDKKVWREANGHIAYESDHFDVFIDHTNPTLWKVTGKFGQMTVDGELIWLESGKLATPPTGRG